jgi:NADP-dependent 3-hydroxy acid dehydrogenase YdfG
MAKIVFITGATSGFGKSAALLFAANGYNLIINGRRKDRLEELATQIREQHKASVLPLAFDRLSTQFLKNGRLLTY